MATFSLRSVFTVAMTAPVLLGTAAGIMVGLLFYALLVTRPPVEYIVAVLATAGVTGWAALECLFGDWVDRGGHGHSIRRPPPLPSMRPGGPEVGHVGPVDAPVRPVEVIGAADSGNSSSFFRRPPPR